MKDKVEAFLEQTVEQHQLPGLAASVVKGSQLFAAGFGSINISSSDPVTPDTLFHCASISKLFTATAVMQLVENNDIDLDEKS